MVEKTDFYREISSNKRRSVALMFVFALVVMLIGYALGAVWGSPYAGLALAFVVSLAMAWSSYYWSDRIVLSITGARPAEKAEFPQFYNVVEGLSIAAGLPMPKCYVLDDPAPNAFATGRDPQHAVICATTGLLQLVDRYELEGVIAHEMSHIRNYDVRFQTIAVVLAGMIVLMGDWMMRSLFWGRRGRSSRSEGRAGLPILLIGLILAILSPIIAQLLRMAVSRRREYLADASAVQLTRYPEGLASALQKLASYPAPLHGANRATAHLFIVNPFKAGGMESLFSTHPPIADRIARLRAMDLGDPGPRS
jgi:heat shock protein HtpX